MTPKGLFESHVRKVCTNGYRAVDFKDVNGIPVPFPMAYRREDLSNWAETAYKEGRYYFHCEPVDPKDPYGPLRLCEPRYEYEMKGTLTEEEYLILKNSLCQEKG